MAANSQFAVAVHVLAVLAKSGGGKLNSEDIAGSVNTNPVVIRRLLCNLRRVELVVSQTGAGGGTRLSRNPEEINLSEIYRAVTADGVFALHPGTPNKKCPVGRNIQEVLKCLQNDIDETIEQKLASYTLRDIIESVEKNA